MHIAITNKAKVVTSVNVVTKQKLRAKKATLKTQQRREGILNYTVRSLPQCSYGSNKNSVKKVHTSMMWTPRQKFATN